MLLMLLLHGESMPFSGVHFRVAVLVYDESWVLACLGLRLGPQVRCVRCSSWLEE